MAELGRIDRFLALHGSSMDLLTAAKQKQFQKVDDAIQERLSRIEQAKTTIKENAITISSIAKATGISNKTFYNNELLHGFVNEYITSQIDNNGNTIKKLKEKTEEQAKQIRKFVIRDVDTEELRVENDNLSREIVMLQKRITNLEEQNEKLQMELEQARKGYGQIIELKPKE